MRNHCMASSALVLQLCDYGMTVALLAKPTGMVGLGASPARRQPQTIQAGLLDLAPCARHRMRELCQATHDVYEDALDTIVRVCHDECMKSLYPDCWTIMHAERA